MNEENDNFFIHLICFNNGNDFVLILLSDSLNRAHLLASWMA